MTIFYEQRPRYGARNEMKYIDTPMGLVQVKVMTEELVNLEEVSVTWGAEPTKTVDVHTLEMKSNMCRGLRRFEVYEVETVVDEMDDQQCMCLRGRWGRCVIRAVQGQQLCRACSLRGSVCR